MENFIQNNLAEFITSIISGVIVTIIHTMYVNKNSNINNIVESVNNISKHTIKAIEPNNINTLNESKIINKKVNFNSSDNLQTGNNNYQDNSNTLNNIQHNDVTTIHNISSTSSADSDGYSAVIYVIAITIIGGILITLFNKVLLEYSTIFYFLITPPLIISIIYLYSRFAKHMTKTTFLFPLLVILTAFIFLYKPLDQSSHDTITEILNGLDGSVTSQYFENVFSVFLENKDLMLVFLLTHLMRLLTVVMFIVVSVDVYMKKSLKVNTQLYLLLCLIIILAGLIFIPQLIFNN